MGLPLKSQKGYKPGKLDIKAKQQAVKAGNGWGKSKGLMTTKGKPKNSEVTGYGHDSSGFFTLSSLPFAEGGPIPDWANIDLAAQDTVLGQGKMFIGGAEVGTVSGFTMSMGAGGYNMTKTQQEYNPYPEPDIQSLVEGMTLEEIREMELLTGKDLLPKEYKEGPAKPPSYTVGHSPSHNYPELKLAVSGHVLSLEEVKQLCKIVNPACLPKTLITTDTLHIDALKYIVTKSGVLVPPPKTATQSIEDMLKGSSTNSWIDTKLMKSASTLESINKAKKLLEDTYGMGKEAVKAAVLAATYGAGPETLKLMTSDIDQWKMGGNQLPDEGASKSMPFCDNKECKYHGYMVGEHQDHIIDYEMELDWDSNIQNKLQRHYLMPTGEQEYLTSLCPSCSNVCEMLGKDTYQWIPSI